MDTNTALDRLESISDVASIALFSVPTSALELFEDEIDRLSEEIDEQDEATEEQRQRIEELQAFVERLRETGRDIERVMLDIDPNYEPELLTDRALG